MAICENMGGPWEYHAKQSQKKLRTTWAHSYVGYKTDIHRLRQQYGSYQSEGEHGVTVKGKGDQIDGDKKWFDFGW